MPIRHNGFSLNLWLSQFYLDKTLFSLFFGQLCLDQWFCLLLNLKAHVFPRRSLLLIFHFNIFSIMQLFNFMLSQNFSLIFLKSYLHDNCSFVLLLSKSNSSHFQQHFFLKTCSIYVCLHGHACTCVCVYVCVYLYSTYVQRYSWRSDKSTGSCGMGVICKQLQLMKEMRNKSNTESLKEKQVLIATEKSAVPCGEYLIYLLLTESNTSP